MTDRSLATKDVVVSNAPPLDDQLVYVPLDALPKDFLSKLEDFKVIVKDDKAGDRILPKEKLGEVLRSLKRGHSLLPAGGENVRDQQVESLVVGHLPTSPSPDTTELRSSSPTTSRQRNDPFRSSQKQFENCKISMERDYLTETFNPSSRSRNSLCKSPRDQFQDSTHLYQPNKSSDIPKSPTSSMPFPRNNYPSLFDETILGRQRLRESLQHDTVKADDFAESEPIYGFGTTSRVSMDTIQDHQRFLETTPRKSAYADSALADISFRQSPRHHEAESYLFREDPRYIRNLPSPNELSRAMQNAEVTRARKQLFMSPRSPYDSHFDNHEYQKENYLRYSRSPRDFRHLDYTVMDDMTGSPRRGPLRNCSPLLVSERGLKRKYYAEDDEAYLHPGPSENTRMTSSGIADRLLDDLHPSKRPCYDIGPADKMECPASCACAMMESHFLQMTEGAYKNIRRKDSTSASFEQFRKELIQTNSVLKESVSILRSIKQICSHTETRKR